MATTLDTTNGIVHCWIRNATTNTLNYPCSDFGDNQFVTFDIRAGSNWVSLEPWVFPGANDIVVPEPPYRAKTVKPYQIIRYSQDMVNSPRVINGRDTLIQRAITVAGLEGPDNVMLTNMCQAINKRWIQLTNWCNGDTFALDFVVQNSFATSGFTNQSAVTARVSQKFRMDGGRKVFVLTSPEFKCPVFKYDTTLLNSCRKH